MLCVTQLIFERNFQPVFQPLDFDLERGSLLVITGANGCGKTTLIRLLAGVLTATEGEIQSNAVTTAYVGHLLAVKDDLSVLENLRFMRDFLGTSSKSLDEIIDELDLYRVADQLARTLSAGQRKRCALGRLLLTDADLWLLDEPYSNLDSSGISLLDQLLQNHSNTGGSCVLATHGDHRPVVHPLQEIEMISGLDY
jgi:heme exporter protein A